MTWADALEPTEDRVLASGLRVLCVHRPGLEFAVVLSQSRGGSRADPPGGAGLAHLTEHLLAQGLAPGGQRWGAPILAAGGDFTGTTHPDYVEFCSEVPYAALPGALAAERARLASWPVLGEGVFERQRAGVCQEIEDHGAGRPTRTLPWPALGPRLFDSWADSHDPFGEVEHVRGLTPAACRRFFEDHHRPDRTVLVVLADLTRLDGGTDAVYADLQMPPRAGPAPEPTADPVPEPAADLVSAPHRAGIHPLEDWTAPHSVGSVGWRVPSVVDETQTYAALLAVAAQLGRHPRSRARLGQMTPMDRATGDALTLTVLDPRDARPVLERAMAEPLRRLERDHATTDEAIDRARTAIAATLDRPRTAAQLLGRAVSLAGDPLAAGRWVEAVRSLQRDDVVTAARELSRTEVAGLVGRPSDLPRGRHTTPAPEVTRSPDRNHQVPTSDGSPEPPDGPPESPGGSQESPDGPSRSRLVQPLSIERPSRAAAVAARIAPTLGAHAAQQLRARGYHLTQGTAGWLVEHHRNGRADTLASTLRDDLADVTGGAGADVRHLVLVGDRASAAEPWHGAAPSGLIGAPGNPTGAGAVDGFLDVLVSDDLPHDTASAELRWSVPGSGFVARWIGIALLIGIHSRDADGQVHPLDAPPGTFLAVRQDPSVSGPELIAEVYAPPDLLPGALQHLVAELTWPQLERRCRHTAAAVTALAAGWHRDAADSATLARRGSVVLDLGGVPEDVREFVPRLHATCPATIVDRLRQDTAAAPRGTIRTSRPEALRSTALPWRLATPRDQVTPVT